MRGGGFDADVDLGMSWWVVGYWIRLGGWMEDLHMGVRYVHSDGYVC